MPPYKSAAQQRYFHYLESKGKMPKKTVEEFDEATDFEHLPEKKKEYYAGGMVAGETEMDEEMGMAHDPDSSGDPHPDEHDKEHMTEYMSKGGVVRKMSRGGMVHNSEFAKALRKKY